VRRSATSFYTSIGSIALASNGFATSKAYLLPKRLTFHNAHIRAKSHQRRMNLSIFGSESRWDIICAIEADPNFALAHAQLASAYAWTAIIIEPTEPVWAERAKEAINGAQTLDSQLAETHLARYLLLSSRYEGYQNETAVRALF